MGNFLPQILKAGAVVSNRVNNERGISNSDSSIYLSFLLFSFCSLPFLSISFSDIVSFSWKLCFLSVFLSLYVSPVSLSFFLSFYLSVSIYFSYGNTPPFILKYGEKFIYLFLSISISFVEFPRLI